MIKRLTGEPNIMWFPKTASVVINNGGLVYSDGSGAIQAADATAGDLLGISLKTTAATDDDYALNTYIPVDVPRPGEEFLADVGTGTLTTAMIGNRYDLKDDNEIDVSATSKLVVTITRFISASQAAISVNAMIHNVNVATS